MMKNNFNPLLFPFGQQLQKLTQVEKSPKKVFVLGVYASAVHARWRNREGSQIVAALAVASEPEIFWTGNNAASIIEKIVIPEELGYLDLPVPNLNGPSGRALDDLYLKPLDLERSETWLCDLIPETRLNPNQKNAIKRHYTPIRAKFNLPKVSIPPFRQSELDSQERRTPILEELFASQAETIILLGDMPIKYFLNFFIKNNFDGLASFGTELKTYGQINRMMIAEKPFNVIPLCHPRQAQRLGFSSARWYELHKTWMLNANKLI
jgi:uracil-DNA glycosylase